LIPHSLQKKLEKLEVAYNLAQSQIVFLMREREMQGGSLDAVAFHGCASKRCDGPVVPFDSFFHVCYCPLSLPCLAALQPLRWQQRPFVTMCLQNLVVLCFGQQTQLQCRMVPAPCGMPAACVNRSIKVTQQIADHASNSPGQQESTLSDTVLSSTG
jgi:hypothetical protein